jgi:cytochrome c oxidase subunit 2
MSPQRVFEVFLGLVALWTAIWVFVIVRSSRAVPYADVAPRVARLRRRLAYTAGLGVLVIFLVSMRGLPYPSVRGAVLGAPAVTVEVAGVQWAWRLSRSEVPTGVTVEFAVAADDVNHGLGIYDPRGILLAQVQAMPGYTNRLLYRFTEPGRYTLRCLEYCGVAHHVMLADLNVIGNPGAR